MNESDMMETVSITIPKDLFNQAEKTLAGRGLSVDAFIRVALRGALQRNGYVPLKAELTFGKYRGETLETIIRADPEYIRWMLTNSNTFSTDDAAIDLLEMIAAPKADKQKKSREKKEPHPIIRGTTPFDPVTGEIDIIQ